MASNDGSFEKVQSQENSGERQVPRERFIDLLKSIDAGDVMIMGILTMIIYVSCFTFNLAVSSAESHRVALRLEDQNSKTGKHATQFVIPDSILCETLLSDLAKAGFSMKIGGEPVAVGKDGVEAGCRLKSKDLLLWKKP